MTDIEKITHTGCGHQDGNGLDPQLAEELGLNFPESHYEPCSLSAMAVGIMKKSGTELALLPFCCTVEAEALGAKINLGNATIGPRPGELIHRSLDEFMAAGREMDFGSGRPAAILMACEQIAAEGHKVAVEISGPLSILSGLLDLSLVVKTWRKDERLLGRAFEHLGRQIIRYALALKKSGAAVISYADPIATPKIIGPKYSKALADSFLTRFLNKLSTELQGSLVHLCPGTAHLLVDCGLGRWRPIRLRPGMSYQQGCLELAGQVAFLGQACLKRLNYHLLGGNINEFKLNAAAFG